ncbi:hypothetical protein L1887_51592 [Cichorium endivia]|nr:hypothetical protein L1887_51592 [Cichorium endivia]
MEQPRWTSSRVANRRATQSSTPAPASTSASASTSARPGATSAPSTSGAAQSRWAPSSSSSTWRTQPPAPAPRANNDTRVSNSATGASSSRWARTSAPSDHDMAALTATLGSTSIRDSGRRDGLHVRDTTRPLGGKTLDRLALLASPSRGLDSSASIASELASQGSMDLTSASVQAELRGYIGDRLTTRVLPLLSAHVPPLAVLDSATYLGAARASAAEKTAADEELGQLMLQTRKLREAVVSSQRVDAFAVDVYELSTYMALLCADVPQLAATLPRLVTELYPRMEPQDCPGASGVRELATRLGLEMYDAAERRMRMCSVYLLYVLCLSGRAVRLGQYAQDAAGGTQHGLREYRLLRSKLLARYPDLEPRVRFCDRDGWMAEDVGAACCACRARCGMASGHQGVHVPTRLVPLGRHHQSRRRGTTQPTDGTRVAPSFPLATADRHPSRRFTAVQRHTRRLGHGLATSARRRGCPRSPLPHIAHPHACITSNVDSVGRSGQAALVVLHKRQARRGALGRLDRHLAHGQLAGLDNKVASTSLVCCAGEVFDELALRVRDERVGKVLLGLPVGKRSGRVVRQAVHGVLGSNKLVVRVAEQLGLCSTSARVRLGIPVHQPSIASAKGTGREAREDTRT